VQKHYHEIELTTDVLQVNAAFIEAIRCGFVNAMDDEGISTGLKLALCISRGRISSNRDVVSMAGFIFRIGLELALCSRGGIRRGDGCGFITAIALSSDAFRIGFANGMDGESIVSMAGFFLGFFTVGPDDISTTEMDAISKC
jgi:hypothetical protein